MENSFLCINKDYRLQVIMSLQTLQILCINKEYEMQT